MTAYERWEEIRDNYINGNISDTKELVKALPQKQLLAVVAIGTEEDPQTLKQIIQMVNR